MKIENSMLMPKLREFVENSCREDSAREVLTEAEIKDLLSKHFPGLDFFDSEMVGKADYHTGAFYDSRKSIMKIAVQRFFPKDNVELRVDSTKLTIHYLPLRRLTMEGWGYGCGTHPEPFATQERDFLSEIKSRSGPDIDIALPEKVKILQISELGHSSVGFVSEIEALSEKIRLANRPQDVTHVEIGAR